MSFPGLLLRLLRWIAKSSEYPIANCEHLHGGERKNEQQSAKMLPHFLSLSALAAVTHLSKVIHVVCVVDGVVFAPHYGLRIEIHRIMDVGSPHGLCVENVGVPKSGRIQNNLTQGGLSSQKSLTVRKRSTTCVR